MQQYYLMNKNDKLLAFQTEPVLGGTQVRQTESFDKRRPFGFSDIATWVEQRNYAKHKDHFKKWLKEWGIDTVDGFLLVTHALGINDTLWVKPVDSKLTWEQVNLYDNEFTDVATKTAFETGLHGLQISSTSPEFTSEGTFPKCWSKTENGIMLYKAGLTGAANVGLEPYSEYMSSRISLKLSTLFGKCESTRYDLEQFKDKICSTCSLFTNQNIGFAPAYRFIDRNRIYNLNDVLQMCSQMGFEEECREMILIDYIVFNKDRHLGNFGFLFNNDTFEIVGFAPLFDFNLSMLCNAMEEDLKNYPKYEEEFQVGHKLGGIFSEIGNQILTPHLQECLPRELRLPLHKVYNLSTERLELLSPIFQKNYDKIRGKGRNFYIHQSLNEYDKTDDEFQEH